ncbi:amine oxidase [Scenedesmus sp. NREL 46B-D3]|nr:amine oxidase [Scenedesmus sp. NREL 46B-D3]
MKLLPVWFCSQTAVQKFLAQLDDIFGSAQEPKPASSAYIKAHVFDWSQEQWVGGAYSFPSFGAEEGDREALAAPVAGTIFFAGEATHSSVNPCIQAALETGERAARQVSAALNQTVSKL